MHNKMQQLQEESRRAQQLLGQEQIDFSDNLNKNNNNQQQPTRNKYVSNKIQMNEQRGYPLANIFNKDTNNTDSLSNLLKQSQQAQQLLDQKQIDLSSISRRHDQGSKFFEQNNPNEQLYPSIQEKPLFIKPYKKQQVRQTPKNKINKSRSQQQEIAYTLENRFNQINSTGMGFMKKIYPSLQNQLNFYKQKQIKLLNLYKQVDYYLGIQPFISERQSTAATNLRATRYGISQKIKQLRQDIGRVSQIIRKNQEEIQKLQKIQREQRKNLEMLKQQQKQLQQEHRITRKNNQQKQKKKLQIQRKQKQIQKQQQKIDQIKNRIPIVEYKQQKKGEEGPGVVSKMFRTGFNALSSGISGLKKIVNRQQKKDNKQIIQLSQQQQQQQYQNQKSKKSVRDRRQPKQSIQKRGNKQQQKYRQPQKYKQPQQYKQPQKYKQSPYIRMKRQTIQSILRQQKPNKQIKLPIKHNFNNFSSGKHKMRQFEQPLIVQKGFYQKDKVNQVKRFLQHHIGDQQQQKKDTLRKLIKTQVLGNKKIQQQMQKIRKLIFYYPSIRLMKQLSKLTKHNVNQNDIIFNSVVFRRPQLHSISNQMLKPQINKIYKKLRAWGMYLVDIQKLQLNSDKKYGFGNNRTYVLSVYNIEINIRQNKVSLKIDGKQIEPNQFNQKFLRPQAQKKLREKGSQIYYKYLKQSI